MYRRCELCPRKCRVNRENGVGVCHVGAKIKLARAALHMWEEPCISGTSGSGAIFFSGCNLGCVYCQNYEISGGQAGKEISVDRLVDIFFQLKEKGACNINFVTPDPFIPSIKEAIISAKEMGFDLPFIYNCSGYVTPESLGMLDGLIDVYLPDFKYWEMETAGRYSRAKDYPQAVKVAIREMVHQVGQCEFDEEGMIRRGVIVRHLLLPGKVREAKSIVKYLYETYGDGIYLSLMNQYTPVAGIKNVRVQFPELQRKVTDREYERWIQYVLELGVKNAFVQEGCTAEESFIPAFDMEGV